MSKALPYHLLEPEAESWQRGTADTIERVCELCILIGLGEVRMRYILGLVNGLAYIRESQVHGAEWQNVRRQSRADADAGAAISYADAGTIGPDARTIIDPDAYAEVSDRRAKVDAVKTGGE